MRLFTQDQGTRSLDKQSHRTVPNSSNAMTESYARLFDVGTLYDINNDTANTSLVATPEEMAKTLRNH
jgi:hypothetical protein